MGTVRTVSGVALAAGLLLVGYAALQGQLSVHLVLVFPVVTGTGVAGTLGMLLVIAGGFGWLLSSGLQPAGWVPDQQADANGREGEASSWTKPRSGGVIMIGPLPIAWGTDRQSLVLALVLMLVLVVVVLLAVLFLGLPGLTGL